MANEPSRFRRTARTISAESISRGIANATGATSTTVWSSTNLAGVNNAQGPAWLTPTVASAAANPTGIINISEIYPTAVKSASPGVAVTIVPQATTASGFLCAHAVGYYSPQLMRLVLALGLLGFASLAQAQEVVPKLTLSVTTEQAQLIVQTLGAIVCQNVTQLAICQQAAELLRSLREQIKTQVK